MSSMIARRSEDAFFKPSRTFPSRSGNGKGFPIGKRTKARAAGNRDLNKLPREVTHRCELRVRGVCIGDRMLTWAHSKKSRFLVNKSLWREACRACLACHQAAEQMSHKAMHALITAAIRRRK